MEGELTLAGLAEKYDEDAAGCACWAREARIKRKAAFDLGDMAAFERWAGIARDWGSQAAQLRRDAAALRAQAGEKPQVQAHNFRGRATPMEKW